MDDLTFYRSRADGYLARQIHRHDLEKVKTTKNFARTMVNATEFGQVAKVACTEEKTNRAWLPSLSRWPEGKDRLCSSWRCNIISRKGRKRSL